VKLEAFHIVSVGTLSMWSLRLVIHEKFRHYIQVIHLPNNQLMRLKFHEASFSLVRPECGVLRFEVCYLQKNALGSLTVRPSTSCKNT
jgi:hypothetical protein